MYIRDADKNNQRTRRRITKLDPVKLKKLTDRFNLPEYMGELFLNEIKLSKNSIDDKAREIAKLLGLME